ncbi:hypothetical protein [Pedobacter sp. MW01-1-1]|uniref:hypothetical protein n=1 Tax=Pedobacter sp. MW01-1-1 TaxID=3383027 RepID=UPI003FF07BB5
MKYFFPVVVAIFVVVTLFNSPFAVAQELTFPDCDPDEPCPVDDYVPAALFGVAGLVYVNRRRNKLSNVNP